MASTAYADDAPASEIAITGSAAVTTQYRLRGISQTDNRAAVQGSITVTHSPTGVYVSTWASNLGGNGTWGGSNMELDLIAGKTTAVGPVTLDGGGIYYVYPGTSGHDYFEIYGSVAGKVGPLSAKGGLYWAPKQNKIGGHNIWLYTDWGFSIPDTPVTLKAHAGYSTGNSIYTRGGSAGTGAKDIGIFDYGVGADFTYKMLTLNVSYVGTDMGTAFANANFGAGLRTGHAITKGAVVGTLTAAF
ncbi:MAG: hypothetical protein JF595_10610 [Sphingomonadales bacterium]|nr:hypothetical protein [Sphingomonadales bacterium]